MNTNSIPVSALIGLRNAWVAQLQPLPPADRLVHPIVQCIHDLDAVIKRHTQPTRETAGE